MIHMIQELFGQTLRRHLGSLADRPRAPDVQRNTAMTIEILYLTHQLQRWINRRVARHLAAQAARLSR
jgi:hypothetical protein